MTRAPHPPEAERTITVPSRKRSRKIATTLRRGHAGNGLLKVSRDFYLLTSSMASRRTARVLSRGEAFAIFEATGDILDSPLEALGFFYRDTRHLSRFDMMVAGEVPHLLNSYISDDNAEFRANLANPDIRARKELVLLRRDSIQIERRWTLCDSTLLQGITLRSYASSQVSIELDFLFRTDFGDIFEVRGVTRRKRGRAAAPAAGADYVEFGYDGIDGIRRSTRITFSRRPRKLSPSGATFAFTLRRGESVDMEIRIEAHQRGGPPKRNGRAMSGFEQALKDRRREVAALEAGFARITTGSELANTLFARSLADIAALTSGDPSGHYIMAGIPWFATVFGRDSLITALSVLPFCPALAAGTLRTLARLQAKALDNTRDEQPGKIVHEVRSCEMANTGEVPFGRYYGSVDSTPLFLWLFSRYISATGDLKFALELWPNVQRALGWVDGYGDRDGDGYLDYQRETPRGLANQGWKDSFDAISHADGTLARPPIAVCEVQGYLYAACMGVADVAGRLGDGDSRDQLLERASALQSSFVRDFWLERERTLALARDGGGRPCRVVASNAAHCVATGLLDGDRAAALADRLLEDDMFSGWGLRTLSARARRYNPMSYHNGSVWPHDNAIAALGLALAQRPEGAVRIMTGLFEAAAQWNNRSLPELFCGFAREDAMGPVRYPVACHPQAWSAASVFLVLQAVLGMEVRGFERRIAMRSPMLPSWLDWVKIEGLKLGGAEISFVARRDPSGASIEVLDRRGGASLQVER